MMECNKTTFCGRNNFSFLLRDPLQCKARSCYRMSSVCSSVCDVGGSWPHRSEILETNCSNS